MTEEMTERVRTLGAAWEDEGGGYWSMTGYSHLGFALAYVALPADHPAIGQSYDDHGACEVNGGLTFSEGNVFGWDYGHAFNSGNATSEIPVALDYFRSLEVAK